MRSTIWLVLWVSLVLLAVSPVSAGDPKSVYIKVWNGNGTDYPTGAAGEHGLTFSCHLEDASNGWVASEIHTQADEGFDYFVLGGSYPNHIVHHLSIQCGNFVAFDWAPGDRLVVEATDLEGAFSGLSATYTMSSRPLSKQVGLILDSEGEQYGPDFILLGELSLTATTEYDDYRAASPEPAGLEGGRDDGGAPLRYRAAMVAKTIAAKSSTWGAIKAMLK